MEISNQEAINYFIGSQEVQSIYLNGVEIYTKTSISISGLELNDLSGYILQEDGSLIKQDK